MRRVHSKAMSLTEYENSKPKDIPTLSQMATKYLKWAKDHKKESTLRTDR